MDLELKGLKAIITGGSRGLGREIGLLLAQEGASIAFFSRKPEQVEQTTAILKSTGVKVVGDALDMTDAAAYKAWLGKAVEQLGGVDIFVHNASAGGGRAGEENWYKNFELDLMGAVRGCETLKPHLVKSKSPAVVMLGSTATGATFLFPQAFNALKAAVVNYAQNLAQEWAKDGIRVNVVAPGPTQFDGGNWDVIQQKMPALYDRILGEIPLKRLGTPRDIASAAVYLASPAARYITGTNVIVDGGFTKHVKY